MDNMGSRRSPTSRRTGLTCFAFHSTVRLCRGSFEPGWKWSDCVKPIAKTNSCQAAHYGYQLSGKLTTRMDEGTEKTSNAGDVLNIPPGHDAWVVGNEPVVVLDFQGMV